MASVESGHPIWLQVTVEVQRAPGLLRAVKRAVDERRRAGRFLLTGSANLLLMSAVSASLAGRAVYLTLGPRTESEKAGRIDALLNQAELARDAGLSRPTTHRWLNLLEVSLLARLLAPRQDVTTEAFC
jgi:predicted AAA+ superfamily ATPase